MILIIITNNKFNIINNNINIFLKNNNLRNFPTNIHLLSNNKLKDIPRINELSWYNFRNSIFLLQYTMKKSYTKNMNSKIIQSLFIQQIKVSKSILSLTGQQIRAGQTTLGRLVIEASATIAWLLKGKDKNKFKSYIMHSLIISNDTINLINKDLSNQNNVLKIQKRLQESSINEYKMAGLNKNDINNFFKLSHNKIHKKYKFPNFKDRSKYLDNSDRIYLMYSVTSSEIHSGFPEVVNKNIVDNNNKFISCLSFDVNPSDARIINSVSISLLYTWNLLDRYGIININNDINTKKLIKYIYIIKTNITKLDYYHESLL